MNSLSFKLMAKLNFFRSQSGLVPHDDEASNWFHALKLGKPISVNVTENRNNKFHRKFFSMLKVAFDNHEWPEIETQWGNARCSFEMFRNFVTVKAGYYTPELTPEGKVKVVPKSISFNKMDEDEFKKLYSDVLDVILKEYLTNWTTGDMDTAVDKIMEFA